MVLICLIASLLFHPQEALALSPADVSVDSQAVVMPVGRVLLVKRENFLGAILFSHNEVRPDGIHSKYKTFESVKGDFGKIGEGEIFRGEAKKGFFFNLRNFFFHDIGRIGEIKIKSFVLYVDAMNEFHSTVYFWEDGKAKPDVKIFLAPTPWKEIGEVNLSDARIRWFAYDKQRNRKVVAIDEIWD